MKFNPEIHHRRSIRLKGYDYSRNGAYFVTICVQNRECLFGEIIENEIELNDSGIMIDSVWKEIPQFYPGVENDAFQIMPNHVHGIIVLKNLMVGAGLQHKSSTDFGGFDLSVPKGGACLNIKGQPRGVAPTLSLPDIIHRFKTLTTKKYIDCVRHKNWQPFLKKLWQRNYYEHIIRNEIEFKRTGEYIINNPINWNDDENNPANIGLRDNRK